MSNIDNLLHIALTYNVCQGYELLGAGAETERDAVAHVNFPRRTRWMRALKIYISDEQKI